MNVMRSEVSIGFDSLLGRTQSVFKDLKLILYVWDFSIEYIQNELFFMIIEIYKLELCFEVM